MSAGEKRSRFRIALDFLKRLLGKKPAPPGDPYAYSMAPRASRSQGTQRGGRRRDRRRFVPELSTASHVANEPLLSVQKA